MLKALFAGTFDPPTFGHIKTILRIASFCDLIVGVGENTRKNKPLLTLDERIETIQKEVSSLSNIQVASFTGLAINFAKEQGVHVLVRGIRSGEDLSYEMEMARINRKLSGGIETLFLMAEDFVSASLIRELALKGASLKDLVPSHIEQTYQHRLQKGN